MGRIQLLGVTVLLGVCLSCPAQPAPVAPTVSFPNGGMRLGGATPEGWSLNWTGASKLALARDTQTYKSVPASLRLASVGSPATGGAGHVLDVGVKRFTLSGSIKASGSLKASLVAVQISTHRGARPAGFTWRRSTSLATGRRSRPTSRCRTGPPTPCSW